MAVALPQRWHLQIKIDIFVTHLLIRMQTTPGIRVNCSRYAKHRSNMRAKSGVPSNKQAGTYFSKCFLVQVAALVQDGLPPIRSYTCFHSLFAVTCAVNINVSRNTLWKRSSDGGRLWLTMKNQAH